MNDPEMIEVIVPVPSTEIAQISPCVEAIQRSTQRDYRLTIAVFGHLKDSVIASLNTMLRSMLNGPWEMFHSKDSGYNSIIHASLLQTKATFQIVVPYDVRIQDDAWFGKMQQPLHAVACTSFCAGTQPKSTLPPVKITKRYSDGPGVFMTSRTCLNAMLKGVEFKKLDSDYCDRFFEALMRSGLFAFYVPSVGTYRVEIGRKRRANQGSSS